MKQLLHSALLILCISTGLVLYGQASWERISPNPQENTIEEVVRIPGTNKLAAIGSLSTIMISDEQAQSWDLILNPAGEGNNFTLTCIQFVDPSTGYVGGTRNKILKTTDGGYSWEKIYEEEVMDYTRPRDMFFTTRDTGFLSVESPSPGDSAFILTTFNGGTTWSRKGYAGLYDIRQFAFFDHLHGMAATLTWQCLTTSDGGVSWNITNQPEDLNELSIREMEFINSDTGFILGESGEETFNIYRTIDKGESWQQVYTMEKEIYYTDLIHYNDTCLDLIILVDGHEKLEYFSSNDGGASWELKECWPGNNFIISAANADESTIVLMGEQGQIYRSTDRGENWDNAYDCCFNCMYPYDLQSIDNTTIALNTEAHDNGQALLRSMDGGISWEEIFWHAHLCPDFCFLNSNKIYAAGYDEGASQFIYSSDGGDSWTANSTGYQFYAHSIKFYAIEKGLISGINQIIRTTDAGNNWEDITPATNIKFDYGNMECTAEGKFYLTGEYDDNQQNSILFTYDFEQNQWQEQPLPMQEVYPMQIKIINDNLAFMMNQNLYKSTDGCCSWETVLENQKDVYCLLDLNFTEPGVGYAVGFNDESNIFKTIDYGDNWIPVNTPATGYLTRILFTDNGKGIACGLNGLLLQKDSEGGFETPVKKSLSISPNPADQWITITYPDTETASVIKIYSIRGQLIMQKYIHGNVDNTVIDVAHLPSGEYLLQYEPSNGQSACEKIIIR